MSSPGGSRRGRTIGPTFCTAVVLALVSLVLCAPAVAQTSGGGLTVDEMETGRFPTVVVTVGVRGGLAGQAVPPSAFRVVENGITRTPQVEAFPPDELDVMLVMDTSGSMTGAPLVAAKAAAKSFLGQMPPGVKVGLIGFGPTPGLASPFTTDRAALGRSVDGLTASGKTALYDAVALAVKQFPPEAGRRRAMVLLSDGGDTASTTSLDSASRVVSESGVRLQVAELVSPESDRGALSSLATAGGGEVASAERPEALAPIFRGLASSLVDNYRLTFRSGSSANTDLLFVVEYAGQRAEHRLSTDFPLLQDGPGRGARNLLVGGWVLLLGTASLFLSMLMVGVLAFAGPPKAPSDRLGAMHPQWSRASAVGRVAERIGHAAEAILVRTGRLPALQLALERAGLTLSPGEFAATWACVAATALVVGYQLGGALLALALVLVVGLASRLVLKRLTRTRQRAFAAQLVDVLQLLSGSLRAGYGLLQACEAVAQEAQAPASDEFRRLLVETRLGREVVDSLQGVADRVGSQDFEWVVTAIDIHREVGGDLAEVLDNVSRTIRDRDQIRRQIQGLSAEARLSSYVLIALPFVLVILLQLLNPGYLDELGNGSGPMLVGIALGLMLVGGLWLKRLCRLVF